MSIGKLKCSTIWLYQSNSRKKQRINNKRTCCVGDCCPNRLQEAVYRESNGYACVYQEKQKPFCCGSWWLYSDNGNIVGAHKIAPLFGRLRKMLQKSAHVAHFMDRMSCAKVCEPHCRAHGRESKPSNRKAHARMIRFVLQSQSCRHYSRTSLIYLVLCGGNCAVRFFEFPYFDKGRPEDRKYQGTAPLELEEKTLFLQLLRSGWNAVFGTLHSGQDPGFKIISLCEDKKDTS